MLNTLGTHLYSQLQNEILKKIYNNIWIPHNQDLNIEDQLNNITQQMKRLKSNSHNKPKSKKSQHLSTSKPPLFPNIFLTSLKHNTITKLDKFELNY